MKKLLLTALVLCTAVVVYAGGIVTNTMQSAMFTRFQCRDATINIDAAYYNPAGLVHFSDGFFISVNNMSLGETRLIESDYDNFITGSNEFNGRLLTPVIPAVYTVYKKGRLAFSAGINLVSGKGSAVYENGLPSYERRVADFLPYIRNSLETIDQAVRNVSGSDPLYSNVTGYDIDASFKQRSLYPGLQFNMAYMINDYWSLGAGIRLVSGRNRYLGEVSSILVSGTNAEGDFTASPVDYVRSVADAVNDTITSDLYDKADILQQRSRLDVDVLQKGFGVAPVISINYAASLYTNWALKYEFKTKLRLETEVNDFKNGAGMFRDGSIIIADIPAMLSVGVTRRTSNKFMYYAGVHYYFDKPIDFDGSTGIDIDMIDNNSWELAWGAEYKLTNALRISAGWHMSRPGVNEEYQSEMRFSLPSNTIGGGVGIRLSELIDLNLGVSYTLYKKDEKEYTYTPELTSVSADVSEYYDIRTFVFAAGIEFLFGEN